MSQPSSKVVLKPREFFVDVETTSVIKLRERAATFFFRIYAVLILTTLSIFLLQGFHLWGFNLDLSLLRWLGGAAVGEVAGLAAMVFGFLFKKT